MQLPKLSEHELSLPTEKKLFFPYLLAGFPSTSRFADILDVTMHYADCVEIGIPFSDPVADGPVIREAAAQVLARGFQIEAVFKILQRKPRQVPIALMSYGNPMLAYGRAEFLKACRDCNVQFLIVPDVPFEESVDWKQESHEHGIAWISFVSLLTRAERLKRIAASAEGFIYLLSLTGITGATISDSEVVRRKAIEIRKFTRIPIALGFGIRTAKDALPYLDVVDAFIVGSKMVELISTTTVKAVETFYREFCATINNPL